MPYYDVPQPSQQINITQPLIKQNFTAIKEIIEQDHISFDNATVANWGKHKYTDFVRQGADKDPDENDIALYVKRSDLTTASELFLKRHGTDATLVTARQKPFQPSSEVVANTKSWLVLAEDIAVVYGQRLIGLGVTEIYFSLGTGAYFFNDRPYLFVTPTGTPEFPAHIAHVLTSGPIMGPGGTYSRFEATADRNNVTITWMVIGKISR